MENTVAFPGLGLSFHLNRVAFSVFGIDIYYYGLIIMLGVALAIVYAVREAKRVGLNPEIIFDVVLLGIPAAIICARLYFVLFSLSNYKDDWMGIFRIRDGGLAIYGGLIGAVIVLFIYCKVKKLSFFKLADVCAPGLLIGQAIGRWGNFINQEAFGGNTTLPWGMTSEGVRSYLIQIQAQGYPVDPNLPVHPTFLYESLWNALGLVLLLWLRKHKKFEGELILLYAAWYGVGRMFIEGLRTDSLMWGSIRVSQLFAGLTAVLAVVAIAVIRTKKRKQTTNADSQRSE